jgi:hypothetical protein
MSWQSAAREWLAGRRHLPVASNLTRDTPLELLDSAPVTLAGLSRTGQSDIAF